MDVPTTRSPHRWLDPKHPTRAPRALVFVGVCAAMTVWAIAYFAAGRLVDPSGTSGTILGDLVYPQLEALATALLILGRATDVRPEPSLLLVHGGLRLPGTSA